jgi:phosphoesterase RecJ-like protein
MMKVPNKILRLIRDADDFLLVTHVKPEGDAVGSALALALGLRKMGKRVCLVDRDPVPYFLRFLPASRHFRQRPPRRSFEVLLLLDCNTLERAGFKQGLRAEKAGVIDHHIMRKDVSESKITPSGQVNYIDPEAAATGILVYKVLRALKVEIDERIATNLYTAILVDTGGFRYSNTDSESLSIGALLVEAGARPWTITKELYENSRIQSVRLLSLALSTIALKDGVAWMSVTKDMLDKTGSSSQDTEDFVNYPRGLQGVEVAAFFREEGSGFCKISLRSKGRVNVAKVAEGFGGGGHAAAAGCRLEGSLVNVQKKVLTAVRRAVRNR